MTLYKVALEVIGQVITCVEADNEDIAIERASLEIPYEDIEVSEVSCDWVEEIK